MSTSTTETVRILAAELAAVRGELTRVDGKCATLTGLTGAGLAFVLTVSTAPRLEMPVRVLLAAAALYWTGAALLLLVRVLLPHLGTTGFCRWADASADRILAEVAETSEDFHIVAELVVLSGIARRKYAALRVAVVLLALGVVALAAAILAGVIA